ncbi:MAG: hypothetical protein ABS95_00685 [Verrucomicrobia bacterium SCN 57-15]|nr:MAG: hypothetical protein ABS95_00685 [Verrucomicrobia bacterium SCN 57-15]
MKGVSFPRLSYNETEHIAVEPRVEHTMDQVEKLLELYRQTRTPSERRVLLETARISSPQEFSRLEERILRQHVRGMTFEQLTGTIAAHRGLALPQAEELLRDTVFQHLLDQSKLTALLSQASESAPTVIPTETAPRTSKPDETERHAVEVVILKDGNQREESHNPGGRISEQQNTSHSDAPTSLPRLTPRGICG